MNRPAQKVRDTDHSVPTSSGRPSPRRWERRVLYGLWLLAAACLLLAALIWRQLFSGIP